MNSHVYRTNKIDYLNLLDSQSLTGGGDFAYKKYAVGYDGEARLVATVMPEERQGVARDQIIATFNGRKCATVIFPDHYQWILENVSLQKCDIHDLLLPLDTGKADGSFVPLEPDSVIDASGKQFVITTADTRSTSYYMLFFSDLKTKKVFLEALNNQLICPPKLRYYLLAGYGGNYFEPAFVPASIPFHIFSGLLFTYNQRDVYGFVVDHVRKMKPEVRGDLVMTPKVFFGELEKIIDILTPFSGTDLKDSDRGSGGTLKQIRDNVVLKLRCMLLRYTKFVNTVNLEGTGRLESNNTITRVDNPRPGNFDPINLRNRDLGSYTGYAFCAKNLNKSQSRINP